MSSFARNGLFGGLFDRGAGRTGDEEWLQAMLDTEAALARAAERAGLAPAGSGAAVTKVARAELFDTHALGVQAAAAGNPVPALVRALTKLAGQQAAEGGAVGAHGPGGQAAAAAAAIHLGATSQDIIDTAVMLLARRAIDAVSADLAAAAGRCADLAGEHAATVMAGRTLLQQAVPVTFGLVAAGWLTSIDEARQELHRIASSRLAVQFGGAAGTLASLGQAGPALAALLADELGLAEPVLPWHAFRLRIIELAAALAGTCAVLGKIGRDVTLLAQTEVAEVREDSAGGSRGGSSAMPHKQNPVAAIVLLGCARQAPGLLATLAASAEHEHQRAAGAWHAEWEPLSGLLRLTGSAASWTADLLAALQVDPARMRANLAATHGLSMAENITALLTPALGHLPAHDLVADAARRASADGISLCDALLSDPETAAKLAAADLTRPKIESALEPESYLGASAEFIRRALAAHAEVTAKLSSLPPARRHTLSGMTDEERHTQGMQTRRQVLGDDHVDRAVANTTSFTAPFQDLITRYAWGEIWTRPGLTRAERSMITLTALTALRQEEELAMHVRAALRNGLTAEQIQEVLLHSAIYAGVPAANRAFAVASRVLENAT